MKLTFPDNRKIYLDTKLPYEERKKIVDQILNDWEEFFQTSWLSNTKAKVMLDVLSSYLVLTKEEEEKGKHDTTVLSLKKFTKMVRGDSKVVHFSDLSPDTQALFGLIDGDNESD